MEVTVLGHGSLMSGQGLSFSGTVHVKAASIVALRECRRGFAKLSRYGDRFATDVESPQWPLTGRTMAPTTMPTGEVEVLALTVEIEDFSGLVKREGYSAIAMYQLAILARGQGKSLAGFLWALHEDMGHDRVAYRRRLWALTGFTSPHYIPHPVRLDTEGYALIFLAPGAEGTGADDVIAVRQETGIHAVMTMNDTWRRKPNEDQLTYFLSCLLGGVHGLNVRDLLPTQEDPALANRVREQLTQRLVVEREQFLTVTMLSREQYHHGFGDAETAVARGGLTDFLSGARGAYGMSGARL
ncbi:MAG: hypothetical protein HOP18_21735 [Deltaproteobacteria bacterium]|nr:hypothetical protein [Deltaproteobacteria bacterium]